MHQSECTLYTSIVCLLVSSAVSSVKITNLQWTVCTDHIAIVDLLWIQVVHKKCFEEIKYYVMCDTQQTFGFQTTLNITC